MAGPSIVAILGVRFMHGSIQSSLRRQMLTASACAVLATLAAWLPQATLSAEAPPKSPEKAVSAATPSSKPAEAKRSNAVTARRVEFVSAMILWFAILLAGLGLLLMVMIWGRRVRNFARRRPAASTVPDPFWYLKKNPKAVAHANQPDQSPDPQSGPDSDGQPTP
jgi:hypothetical protein